MEKQPKTFTGEYIKYPNGVVMSIYKQQTVKGTRYYRYYRGRFDIIGQLEIQSLLYVIN